MISISVKLIKYLQLYCSPHAVAMDSIYTPVIVDFLYFMHVRKDSESGLSQQKYIYHLNSLVLNVIKLLHVQIHRIFYNISCYRNFYQTS